MHRAGVFDRRKSVKAARESELRVGHVQDDTYLRQWLARAGRTAYMMARKDRDAPGRETAGFDAKDDIDGVLG